MNHKPCLRVAVLMGGHSSEREVSLSTGKMIVGALDPAKYEVAAIDTQDLLALPNPPVPPSLPARSSLGKGGESKECEPFLLEASNASEKGLVSDAPPFPSEERAGREGGTGGLGSKPDIVFIALHGKGGEDGAVQGLLETLGLPYTGSGILASALAMNKTVSKRLFRAAGIPVIDEIVLERNKALSGETLARQVEQEIGFPIFVKPNAEGSTFGASLAKEAEQLEQAVAQAFRYDDTVLIERYVQGMEITVGILERENGIPEVLPVIEIVPKSAFYDFESKYAEGGSEHVIPARLSPALTERAQQIARQCHELLGCRGMSRTDMIVQGEDLYVLEVNTIPGMTPTSLLPHAAAHAGIAFSALLDRLIGAALNR